MGDSYVDIAVRVATQQEHEELERIMADSLDLAANPKVGIFWYDPHDDVLFGVYSEDAIDERGFPRKTCSKLHRDLWKKEYHRQKYKLGGVGRFQGDYRNVPRGRIFYDSESEEFIICVGDWYDKYPSVLADIVSEFDLEGQVYHVVKDYHWNLGYGWEG